MRADLADRELVGLTLVVQLDGAADGMAGARSTAARGGQETRTFAAFLGVVGIDRGGDEGDVGRRRRAGAGLGAVEPAGVGGGGDDFLAVEQVSRNDLVVVPPSMTTVVSRRALRNRASASLRSRPQAMTLATIES